LNTLFNGIYVAGTLKELQYRSIKVEPGLTEDELRAVERAVGAPLPPDLALLLSAGLPSGEDFPDWRVDPEGEMRRARRGDAVVRGETGDQTDRESRSAGHRAAPIMTVMDITIHASFLPHDHPDASLAFYRDRPEVVPVVLLLLRAGPG